MMGAAYTSVLIESSPVTSTVTKHLIAVALRGGITFAIMGGIAAMLYATGKPNDGWHTLMAGAVAGVVMGASVLYEVKEWSLLKQTVIHALLMLVVLYPIVLISGWWPTETWGQRLFILIPFYGIGAVLWGVFFIIFNERSPLRRRRTDS